MSDLDLLVRVGDLARMGDLLAASGYTPRDPLPSYVGDRQLEQASREHVWAVNRDGIDVIVEYRAAAIQTTIGRLGDLDPTLSAALGDCTDAMWSRATRSASDGGLRLAREDLLLLCAAHLAAQHSDFRLIWLHDLARIASHPAGAIDWDEVCARAVSLRIAVPIWAALQAAAQWIGAPIDTRALERLHSATDAGSSALARWERARLREHVAGLADADLSSPGLALWPFGAAVGRMRGWRPRLTALRWALFPSRDYLTRHGEPPPGPLGYLTTWTRRAFLALTRTTARRSEDRGRPLS
jgi:hypothetical protein